MASEGMRIVAGAIFLVATVLTASGHQLHIKHAPKYVVFQSQTPDSTVSSSNLHNILAVPFGISNKQSSVMQSKSVLTRPKANFLFTITTHKDQDLPLDSVAQFPLNWDVPFVDNEHLMNSLQKKFLDKEPIMLDLMSSNQFFDIKTSSPLFQSLPSSFDTARTRYINPKTSFITRLPQTLDTMSLNSSLPADAGLLAEIQMVDDILNIVRNKAVSLNSGVPDLFSFTLTGLSAVNREYGAMSKQANDGLDLIVKYLKQITKELTAAYKDNVMILVATAHGDISKVRKTRSLMQAGPSASRPYTQSTLNLEIDWHSEFPAIFNIVLWLMIILAITIFFVAYGIWNLNPNLESILYRVPQDDLKKNN